MTEDKKQPEKTFKVGGVEAVIWFNEKEFNGIKKKVPNIQVLRNYF